MSVSCLESCRSLSLRSASTSGAELYPAIYSAVKAAPAYVIPGPVDVTISRILYLLQKPKV